MITRLGRRLDACWRTLSDTACLGDQPGTWAQQGANGLYTALRRTGADIHNPQGLAMALAFCAGRGRDGERAYRVLSRACLASLRLPLPKDGQADLLALLQQPDTRSAELMRFTDECAECCGLLTKLLSGAGARDEEESAEAEADGEPEPAEHAPDGA